MILVGDSFRTKHPRGLHKQNDKNIVIMFSTTTSMYVFIVEKWQVLRQNEI